MKKVWEAPELLAVVHGSPEEAVLWVCYDENDSAVSGCDFGSLGTMNEPANS